MKTILLPTDFSQHSERALEFAIEIAKYTNARILVVHSYNVPVFDANVPTSMFIDLCEDERIEVERKLQKICRSIFEYRSTDGRRIRSDYVAEFGLPTTEISKLTEEKNIDLIIMGTEETDHLLLSLGSITMDVLNKVKCPVLIVKENTTFNSFQKIYLAVEDIKSEIKILNQLIPIGRIFNSEITVLHVSKYSTTKEHFENIKSDEEFAIDYLTKIRKTLDYQNITLKYYYSNQKLESFMEIINDENLNLLVLLKQDRNWLENLFHKSIIKAVIQKSDIPLLILHNENK